MAWNLEQDRGRAWSVAIDAAIQAHPAYEHAIRAYRGRWRETMDGPIAANVALLAELRAAKVPCFAITNFAADTFDEARALHPFLDTFDGMIVSGREGLVKPDAAIYRLLLDRYGLDAAACTFIDDSAANVAGAAAVGYRTIHYSIGLNLRSALRQHGFPV